MGGGGGGDVSEREGVELGGKTKLAGIEGIEVIVVGGADDVAVVEEMEVGETVIGEMYAVAGVDAEGLEIVAVETDEAIEPGEPDEPERVLHDAADGALPHVALDGVVPQGEQRPTLGCSGPAQCNKREKKRDDQAEVHGEEIVNYYNAGAKIGNIFEMTKFLCKKCDFFGRWGWHRGEK